MSTRPTALITGASSGIGAATALTLAKAGYNLSLCARREKELLEVARTCGDIGALVYAQTADMLVPEHRAGFIDATLQRFPHVDVLINNAGLALGLDPYLTAKEEEWRIMFETNVFATADMVRRIAPRMLERGSGHLIFLDSIAGHQPYEGGSGYCASKHAQRAMVESLHLELAASPLRITSISPGMVDTGFSTVRFSGDKARADQVYHGITPLSAQDIAETILFAVTRPPHVNISELHIFPVHQVDARKTVRSV